MVTMSPWSQLLVAEPADRPGFEIAFFFFFGTDRPSVRENLAFKRGHLSAQIDADVTPSVPRGLARPELFDAFLFMLFS
jgi:hypothetical protein